MNEPIIIITDHAYERSSERLNLSRRSTYTLAEKAYLKGLAHKDCKGRLERYISALYLKNRTANNIRIYGQ